MALNWEARRRHQCWRNPRRISARLGMLRCASSLWRSVKRITERLFEFCEVFTEDARSSFEEERTNPGCQNSRDVMKTRYRYKRKNMTAAQWARDPLCAVDYKTLLYRLKQRWPIEMALGDPSQRVSGPKHEAVARSPIRRAQNEKLWAKLSAEMKDWRNEERRLKYRETEGKRRARNRRRRERYAKKRDEI